MLRDRTAQRRNLCQRTGPDATRVTATCRILKAVFRRLPTGMKKRCRRRCRQITQKLSAGEQLKSYLTTYGWVATGPGTRPLPPPTSDWQNWPTAPYCEWRLVTGRSRGYGVPEGSQGAYRAQLQNSAYTPALGTATSASEYHASKTQDPQSAILKLIGFNLTRMTNWTATYLSGTGTTTNQLNPLIK